MTDYGHWKIDHVGIFDPAEWVGFIYQIVHRESGKAYVGKKLFRHKRQKTKSNPSRTKESDWRTYTSSCEPLNDLIAERGKQEFEFTILRLCSGKCELGYSELEIQFRLDVLRARTLTGEPKYFNRTIGHFNYAGLEKQTLESRRKLTTR